MIAATSIDLTHLCRTLVTVVLIATAGVVLSIAAAARPAAAATPVPTKVVTGFYHSCALMSDKTVRCWGWNPGDGSTNRTSAVKVTGLSNVVALDAGGWHTCAVTGGGDLYCWGANNFGQVGNGTVTTRTTPVRINPSGAPRFFDVSTGLYHSCALHGNATFAEPYCWGRNTSGELGMGHTNTRYVPTRVATGPWQVVDGYNLTIEAGQSNTCVQTLSFWPNGKVNEFFCAGSNGGTWGNGSSKGATRFTKVASVSDESKRLITTGLGSHLCRQRMSDGFSRCTGGNTSGQLGNGNTTSTLSMVTVPGSPFASLSAGYLHTCGFASAFKEYRCWGSNFTGQIGDGTTTKRSTPTPALAFDATASTASIAAGAASTCAVANDTAGARSVLCWGADTDGVLGNGAGGDSRRPVKVLGL